MWDLTVIGSGISGFSAALFAARRGLRVLVLGKEIGGQAASTDLIENYPGIREIGGLDLVQNIRRQAQAAGADYLSAEAERIKPAGAEFVVTASGRQYKTRAVILALGKTPIDLGVPGEKEYLGKGLSYCANCDLPFFRKKIVAVAGSGDLATDASLMAAKYASQVYLIAETRPGGHPALLTAIAKKKKIKVLSPCRVTALAGKLKLAGLTVLDRTKNQAFKLPVDGLFVEQGFVVRSGFLQGLVDLDEAGQVMVGPSQETSCPGIFAAGDATDRPYKQAVISAGDAATAALAAYDHLQRQDGLKGLTSDWTQVKRVK
ncbi:MAG: NAD(P)/FAD-dependent oxidoreductase [Candidatus Saccharibacteria bacterium]